MTLNTYQLVLTFDQILSLVKQLPDAEKLKLGQELEKELRSQKLTQLLASFRTDELIPEVIAEEVESVRAELYARRSPN